MDFSLDTTSARRDKEGSEDATDIDCGIEVNKPLSISRGGCSAACFSGKGRASYGGAGLRGCRWHVRIVWRGVHDSGLGVGKLRFGSAKGRCFH